jgi:hypothetical protein
MPSRSRSAAPHSIFSKLEHLARISGLIRRRSRKFSAEGFLLSLIQCVTRGTSSFHHLALSLAGFEQDSMSRQAMFQRLSPASTSFLVRVLREILSSGTRALISTSDALPFGRILVEDSTVISMAKSNAHHFPNNGNGKVATAGCKINLVTEAVSGMPVDAALHDARSPDQSIAFDLPDECLPGDLILRDRGYFSYDALQTIERRNAFWISRLPASVASFDAEGVELEVVLRSTSSDHLEMDLWLGRHRAHRCRLVATRLDKKKTEKNRRQRCRESRRRGVTPSRKALIHDEWSLLLTNLPEEQVTARQIYQLYSIRWSIEIQFRAMKQSSHLHHSLNHKADPFQVEALLLAVVIRHVLTIDLQARLNETLDGKQRVSIEKLSDAFSHFLLGLDHSNKHAAFQFDLRHVVHEKRKRSTLYATTVQSLP